MVNILIKKIQNHWSVYFIFLMIFGSIIWSSNRIVTELKADEYKRIENYARSLELLSSGEFFDLDVQDFLFKLIKDNNSIPVVLLDEKGHVIDTKNIDESIQKDSIRLNEYITDLKKTNQSIEIKLINAKNFVYFNNSKILNQLRYYPILILILILVFFCFTYWYLKTIRNTEKSFLWAGIAKETAHQIGTPLSSLMGWIELLKLEQIDQETINEIQKDVDRLKDIADRFSKIGSKSELSKNNIITITNQTVNYIAKRISKGIEVNFHSDVEEFIININVPLYSWVIENLMKNAADAMLNKGVLDIYLNTNNNTKYIEVIVADTGSGIPPKLKNKIFNPGYTTKKRGWGLGLSLAKRIINDYHKGKIFVDKSSKESGTKFKILLKK